MEVLPIIIAFQIEGEASKVFNHINQKCNIEKGIDFKSDIPHITLWMGFINKSDSLNLSKEFYKVFRSVSFTVEVVGAELFPGVDGDVLSVNLGKSRALCLLQNRIHHFFEPYRLRPSCYSSMSETTIDYINRFDKKSLDKYDPHVTIGFSDEVLECSIKDFTVSEPKLFLAGNNCTCLKVID